MTDAAAAPSGAVTRSSVVRVGAATALTALCGYAVLYLAARDLEPAGFSVFGVFWGAFGLVSGAAFGLLQETTREIRSAAAADPPAARTHPLRVGAGVGVTAALLIAASSPLWSQHVFVEDRALSVALLCGGLAGFCLHTTMLGALAGVNRWSQYGALMVTDAVLRVAVAVATFAVGWGLGGYLWATVAGAVAWLLLLVTSPTTRAAARLLTAVDTVTFLRGTGHSIAAAGASAVLVMGFPVLLKATSGDDLGATGGVVILAVTLTRAPLLVPLTAMQGNLIAHFVDQRTHRLKALVAPAALVGVVGAAGIALAAAFGPWLLREGFGDEYLADGALLAWFTAAAVAIALLTLTGAATVAAALHRAYSVGWLSATVASTLLLLLPLELELRTVIALLCGPLLGMAVHLAALARLHTAG
ncbi:MAG: hypothetical protein WBB57_12440 [Mycobacterium sp.]